VSTNLKKAKTEFLAAIQADPSAAQPHYLLAQLYRELRNPEASAKEFEEFEKLPGWRKKKVFIMGPRRTGHRTMSPRTDVRCMPGPKNGSCS